MSDTTENSLEELINSLYDMIQDAWTLPLGADKCVLERDRALDLLDEIRACLPSEIKSAKDIVEHRNELLAAGKREADTIKKQAEDYAKKLVSENEIFVEARRKANDMLSLANARAAELKKATNEYCDSSMKKTEELITEALENVKKSHQQFRALRAKRAQDDAEQ